MEALAIDSGVMTDLCPGFFLLAIQITIIFIAPNKLLGIVSK